MALRKMIDSSVVGLRIAEETVDIGVLPGSPNWLPQEPNSYGDFGVEITTLARNPISDDRQAKKGMVVDLAAGGGFISDFTKVNVQEPLQGFFFADLRRQAEFGNGAGVITSVTTTYNAASGFTFAVNDLIFASGFNNPANNGFKLVTVATGTAVTAAGLVAEASPPATARLVKVGQQFAAGTIDVDAAGTLPAITGAGMPTPTPGSWCFLGGDATITKFVNAVNNGFKRIRLATATRWDFDKSLTTMVTEASTTETIQIFIPRSLKNEVGALIKRRTYQLEQTLGAPDNALPSQIQSQYITGAVANTASFSIGVADKVTVDLGYMGLNGETRTGVVGVKSGSRPDLIEEDAFNTSSDFTFMRVGTVSTTAVQSALFGFMTQVTLNVNNNAEAAKAIGVLGGFDITVGKFQVDGEIEAYFTDVAALEAVKANASVTMDMAMVKSNKGVVMDVPLITLGNARLNIEQDRPIKIPCNFNAASGAQVHPSLDHTLYMGFFDYLPTAAE